MKNVLILCTGNSARSIMGEALINDLGAGRLRGFSAGSRPKGEPHPAALKQLADNGHETTAFRSKSWDEFSGPQAPQMDIVITVCDSADGEACPIWPGAPVRAHWGIPDPAAIDGEGQAEAFALGYDQLEARVQAMLDLDLERLRPEELQKQLQAIGASGDGATARAQSK